jgi:hypothetical protein
VINGARVAKCYGDRFTRCRIVGVANSVNWWAPPVSGFVWSGIKSAGFDYRLKLTPDFGIDESHKRTADP